MDSKISAASGVTKSAMTRPSAPPRSTAKSVGRTTTMTKLVPGIDEEANQEEDHGRNKETIEANLQEDKITEEEQREGPHPRTYTN